MLSCGVLVMIGMYGIGSVQKMEGCCSFEVIVGRVCGCNPKDRKRNSEIVPLLSCNWALVVPPRANSSRSGPISLLSFRQWLPLLSSLLLLRNRTKRFRQKFATFCFLAEIRRHKRHVCFLFGVLYNKWYIDHNFQRTKNRGPVSGGGGVGGVRICRVKKTCGSAGGVRARARPR